MIKNLTCIECPNGCQLEVTVEDGKVISVTGNKCKRGEVYGTNEVLEPRRVVTSTVRLTDGRVLPVKTSGAVLKENIFKVMEIINKTVVSAPIKIGDVIVKDVEEGISVISTKCIL